MMIGERRRREDAEEERHFWEPIEDTKREEEKAAQARADAIEAILSPMNFKSAFGLTCHSTADPWMAAKSQ